ncbi:MAG: hypothetical protein JNK47_03960 [Mesorhizobium sp.]|nr:hypothetical protein [Mesorhizobium sp.]MBL8576357.1 hypothetical protein [Mesorhizobium sp.]
MAIHPTIQGLLKRRSVPIDLDPATVQHHAPHRIDKTVADPDVEGVVKAVAEAQQSALQLAETEFVVLSDRSRPQDAARAAIAQAASTTGAKVAQRLDAARAKLVTSIATIEKGISAPAAPINAKQVAEQAEIRAALARMSDKERRDTIASAFAGSKTHVLAALLNGDAFLSGLKDTEIAVHRQRYMKDFHPGPLARRDALNKLLAAYDRSAASFIAMVNDMSESSAARLARLRKQQADDALAAHGE